ncbi:hypothetical protein PPERSA_02935 [Pseudocohnilembus persalinus]|uniref:Cell division cycle protein 123 n=1 Tax=Pseudocohnilembus persalinus TaxID=266149 RepID=A0A0V0QAD3_PSEPJ|nr:hypothetical protein PPERSA_02935 [Pseudocohnilembus persalinus]|eukprot:KRW99103.1 hypothetical protein PPERSA_02935 [Pseudocohnilembus persalinus]
MENVEIWYDELKEYTFESQFIELSIETGFALKKLYQNNFWNKKISAQNNIIIDHQKQKLFKILQLNKDSFIRLSTRSPKDQVFDLDNPQQKLEIMLGIQNLLKALNIDKQELILRAQNQYYSNNDSKIEINIQKLPYLLQDVELNQVLIWLFNYTKKYLKIQNAQQCYELLQKSERVFVDLTNLLIWKNINFNQYQDIEDLQKDEKIDEKQQLCYLCVRKWIDILDENEFRCFFYNKKLTAISQYNPYIYLPYFNEKSIQIQIKTKIYDYFEKIIPKLTNLNIEHGVIDFAIFTNKDQEISSQLPKNFQNNIKSDFLIEKIYVIELNPFNNYQGAGTGGAYFDWNSDIDILNGSYIYGKEKLLQQQNLEKEQVIEKLQFRFQNKQRDNLVDKIFPLFDQKEELLPEILKNIIQQNDHDNKKTFYQKYCTIF